MRAVHVRTPNRFTEMMPYSTRGRLEGLAQGRDLETNAGLALHDRRLAKRNAVVAAEGLPRLAKRVGIDAILVALLNEVLEALDELGPAFLAVGHGARAVAQDGIRVAEDATSAASPGALAVVRDCGDTQSSRGILKDGVDLVLVDVVERLVERLADLLLRSRERALEMHLVQAREEMHTTSPNGVRSVIARNGDLVDELLSLMDDPVSVNLGSYDMGTHVRAVHTRATVHVAQNLSAADTDTVNARNDSVMDLRKLESS